MKIKQLYLECKILLKQKEKHIKANYKEIYKNYNYEQIKENEIKEIYKDLDSIKNYYKFKEKHIYIFFKYLDLINYDKTNILNKKIEITEDNYIYNLSQLPPLRWKKNSFYCQEFIINNLTTFFSKENNKYFVQVKELK